mmetsp:Transcript_22587/g.65063  ORF Transcript_22587/g.65063 Transcript_22587/m.65063 type:complete len:80 (-) Transcript_22587:126-365(-)
MAAWMSTGHMHEKYDADEFGKDGAGGEYKPQVGFGWTNGVALQLLERYGDRLAEREASVRPSARAERTPEFVGFRSAAL